MGKSVCILECFGHSNRMLYCLYKSVGGRTLRSQQEYSRDFRYYKQGRRGGLIGRFCGHVGRGGGSGSWETCIGVDKSPSSSRDVSLLNTLSAVLACIY